MEEKIWEIWELPIGAEIMVHNQDWEIEVATYQWYKNWVWIWTTEEWDVLLFSGRFVQDEQNRFTLLDEEDESNKEIQ